MKPTKRFNYGEVGNAMLVFEIDRYMKLITNIINE
jgi:hypothetical protein